MKTANIAKYIQSIKTEPVSEVKTQKKYILTISSAKPFDEPCNERNKNVPSIMRNTEEYIDFVYNSRPYYFFITLTFGVRTSFEMNCKFVNKFLHRYNISLFKPGYHKRHDWLEGFAFFEDHLSHKIINKKHVHMLIKPNVRFNDFTKRGNRDIFRKAASKVMDEKRRVFYKDHIDIRNAYVGCKNEYLFKQINDTCLYRFKTIGVAGLSDNICC